MKYLITGGAGFIGFNLVKKLAKNKNNYIFIIDDLSKKTDNSDLSHILRKKNVKIIKKDLKKISDFLKNYNFDYIYHFAAILGVQKVIDQPYDTLRENILTTISVINFAKKQKKLKKICFTSTSEVYAYTLKKKLTKYPTPEDTDFLISRDFNPRSSYLLSKVVGEYLINYSRLNYVILRPHNIFGPQMGFVHVIPQLTKKILRSNKKEVLINNPKHKRTFCSIDFAIELIFNITHNKKTSKKVFNIGSPQGEISIMNLAQQINKILGLKTKLIPSKIKKDGSPEKRRPNMKRGLAFTNHKHNFKKGLKETVLWYKKYYIK